MDEDVQHLSLVDHEIREDDHVENLNEKSASRRSFWSNFSFRNRSKAEPSEGDALLDQGNVSEEEQQSFRDGEGMESLLAEDSDDSVEAPPGHQLLSTNSDDEFNDFDEDDSDDEVQQPPDLINMNASEPILNYSHGDESSDDEESDDSGSGTDDEDVAPLPRQKRMGSMQRSMSVRGYSDHGDSGDSMIDPNNRRRIHRRIEGFGSHENKEAETRTLRQRFLDFASTYRMRKMEIGDENLQRKTWLERFDNAVDSVMPADPELEGYIDAFQMRGATSRLPVVRPTTVSETNKSTPDTWKARAVDVVSHRRKALGEVDDKTYILYLECELQNKELELDSWKRRVKEMEEVVKRMKENNDDDDSGSSNAASEEGESEIEWQTGVAKEGTLIDMGGESSSGNPVPATTPQHENPPTEPRDSKARKLNDNAKGQESVFVMPHAPDGPMGDDDFEMFKPVQHPNRERVPPNSTADNSFPLLTSPERHVKTTWIDAPPTIKAPDLLADTSENEGDQKNNDSVGESDVAEETASDEDLQDGAKEGVLIDIEYPAHGAPLASTDDADLIHDSDPSQSSFPKDVVREPAELNENALEVEDTVDDPKASMAAREPADLASDEVARLPAVTVVSDDECDGNEKTLVVPEGDLLDVVES